MQAPTMRREPLQARSRARVARVLDAADRVLATEGAEALTTVRVAEVADISIGSLYHYFADKEAIVEALAVRYWEGFETTIAHLVVAQEQEPPDDPIGEITDALATCFRENAGFRALWFGGLRTERVRDVTRPTRAAVAELIERSLAPRWPDVPAELRTTVARTVVLIGDGLLREAFRLDPNGAPHLLAETKHALNGYIATRLGGAAGRTQNT